MAVGQLRERERMHYINRLHTTDCLLSSFGGQTLYAAVSRQSMQERMLLVLPALLARQPACLSCRLAHRCGRLSEFCVAPLPHGRERCNKHMNMHQTYLSPPGGSLSCGYWRPQDMYDIRGKFSWLPRLDALPVWSYRTQRSTKEVHNTFSQVGPMVEFNFLDETETVISKMCVLTEQILAQKTPQVRRARRNS